MSGDISAMRVGDTLPDTVWQFVDKKGNTEPLPAGTTCSLYIRNKATGVTKTGQGTWNTSNIANGFATYSWSAQDTATAGDYLIWVQYTTLAGGKGSTDPEAWTVE